MKERKAREEMRVVEALTNYVQNHLHCFTDLIKAPHLSLPTISFPLDPPSLALPCVLFFLLSFLSMALLPFSLLLLRLLDLFPCFHHLPLSSFPFFVIFFFFLLLLLSFFSVLSFPSLSFLFLPGFLFLFLSHLSILSL